MLPLLDSVCSAFERGQRHKLVDTHGTCISQHHPTMPRPMRNIYLLLLIVEMTTPFSPRSLKGTPSPHPLPIALALCSPLCALLFRQATSGFPRNYRHRGSLKRTYTTTAPAPILFAVLWFRYDEPWFIEASTLLRCIYPCCLPPSDSAHGLDQPPTPGGLCSPIVWLLCCRPCTTYRHSPRVIEPVVAR